MLGLKLLLSSALTTGTRQSCPTETRCRIYETPFRPKNYLDDVIKMLDYGLWKRSVFSNRLERNTWKNVDTISSKKNSCSQWGDKRDRRVTYRVNVIKPMCS
jgi:hypothetical protein